MPEKQSGIYRFSYPQYPSHFKSPKRRDNEARDTTRAALLVTTKDVKKKNHIKGPAADKVGLADSSSCLPSRNKPAAAAAGCCHDSPLMYMDPYMDLSRGHMCALPPPPPLHLRWPLCLCCSPHSSGRVFDTLLFCCFKFHPGD